ncbi:MAG: CFI-box-CTERM domain-containing protein [Promethearchaeota archaeon]
MIIIDGAPIDPSTINWNYPWPLGTMGNKVITKMANSNEKYYRNSVYELQFEVKLRLEIIEAAKALSKSQVSFATFSGITFNTTFWESIYVSGIGNGFRLKKNWYSKPASAIKDIFTNGSKYKFECASAMVVVYYKAVLEMFEEDRFNKVFNKGLLICDWYKDPNPKQYPLWYTPGFLGLKYEPDQFPGDQRYFNNPDVTAQGKAAGWQGENVIDLGDGTYFGHPFGIVSATYIIGQLNQHKKPGGKSAYLMIDANRPDFQALFKQMFGCFIATAAYNSDLASEVQFLRDYRDTTIRQSTIGQFALHIFETFYYKFSPSLASIILKSVHLRKFTRLLIVDPIVKLLSAIVFMTNKKIRKGIQDDVYKHISSIYLGFLIISQGIGSLIYLSGLIHFFTLVISTLIQQSTFYSILRSVPLFIIGLILMNVGRKTSNHIYNAYIFEYKSKKI